MLKIIISYYYNTSKYPATQWRLTHCKVRMQQHELSYSVIILYHWLRSHKFLSPTLFYLNYLIFSSTPPLLTSALFLSHGAPFYFVYLSCFWISVFLRNFCLLFRTLAFLLKTNPRLYSSIPPAFQLQFAFSFLPF